MNSFQEIKINNKDYIIVDSIQNLRAEDSFIQNKNKLAIYVGNGEARKYVGSYSGEKGKALRDFFNYDKWGVRNLEDGLWKKTIIQENCFFSKENLLKYLKDAYLEYKLQEQIYKNDISKFYISRLDSIKKLDSEELFFSIYDVSDPSGKQQNRAYIRSDDEIWRIWRELVLPKISYLSILKLIIKNDLTASPLFYFRIFLDYQYRSIVHPKLLLETDPTLTLNENELSIIKPAYREGQNDYRKKVIEHMPQCPFTKISDERILIASHIKPYQVCVNEGKTDEIYDPHNGLTLSPTYDKLFDRGFITFTNEGRLICGTQLSPYTWERLNISPNSKNIMRIYPENREKYLEYHRNNVFQDNLSDLI